MRNQLLLLGGILALCGATPAQTTAGSGAPGAQQTGDELGEVIVTALKDRTDIQGTPAAVTVVTGQTLEQLNIYNVLGIQNLVPSVRISEEGESFRLYIRGIGSLLDYYYVPETTAVNLNGTYLPRFATSGSLFDTESVQVLPGPQGVLYGRSAGGGVLAINTNRPTNELEASGSLGYGNYDAIHFDGVGNVPINDQLAVRAAVSYNKHDGYQSLGLDADDSSAIRLSALYTPSDALSTYVWVTHFEQTGLPEAGQYLPYLPGHTAWYIPAKDPVTGLDNTVGNFEDFRYTIAGTEIKYDLGGAEVQYTASFLNQTEQMLRKLTGNDQTHNNAQDQYTQNLHVSGDSGPTKWIGGVDWFYADSRFDTAYGVHQFGDTFPEIAQRSYSAFFQDSWSITNAVRLVGGVRDTRDSLYLAGDGVACFAKCIYSPLEFDKAWNHVDGKGGIEWDAASNVLVYGNIQTGYAPGTLNTFTNASLDKDIKPQTLLAYTAGIKTRTSDRVLTANLEAFYYNYKDLIIQAFDAAAGQTALYNAQKAYVRGLQLSNSFRPTTRDTLSTNIAWTDGTYGRFVASPGDPNLDGLQMTFTPTWTGSLSYDHRFDLANGGTVNARVESYASSRYWGTFDHSGDAYQGSYDKTDASIMYRSPGNHWSVNLYVKNIENVAVNTAAVAGVAYLEAPRTYGITFGFKQ